MVYLGLSGGGIRGRGRQFIENFLFNERKIVCVVRAARNSPWRAQLDNGSFGLATHTHIHCEGNNFYLFVGRLFGSFEKGSSPQREPQSSSITSEHNKTLILIIDYKICWPQATQYISVSSFRYEVFIAF